MKIIVLNAWSSSLKFSVFKRGEVEEFFSWVVKRIWEKKWEIEFKKPSEKMLSSQNFSNHTEALEWVVDVLFEQKIIDKVWEIESIGHRVVHWGYHFSNSVIIDDNVMSKIEECIEIAPLHNPANLACIRWAQKVFSESKHVAVFDTAFHQTLPATNYMYAIPRKYYDKYWVRKYGFHWISHNYVSKRLTEILGKQEEKIITCHIWNWASISAIKDWKCINTSMWFTPVDGLVMWTRSGWIWPWVVTFLQEKENLSPAELRDVLNNHSGVLGLTWKTWDLKDIEDWIAEGNKDYEFALEMYISRIARFLWGYIADLWWVDSIIFTAWVLENSINIRKTLAERLAFCGVEFDESKNNIRGEEALLSTPDSKVKLYLIPTNEELMIKNEVEKLV